MLFNTAPFILFFAVFLLFFRLILRSRAQRIWLIIVGSLFFYGTWDYRFVPLLLSTAMLDYFLAQAVGNSPDGSGKKKALLCLSIAMNLGVLAFFKYMNFFLDSAVSIFSLLGLDVRVPHLGIILPIGISFYTFQSMSYVIDVYRGELAARKRPQEFLAGVSFFPHLVAGPIIRATTLLPQFESAFGLVTRKDFERGALLIAAGLCKKGMADLLSFYADRFFTTQADFHMVDAWIGTLAFAGQIYGDFSGYTDMAIGIALFLGIKLPPNFNLPYLATSVIDFWRRWHMSLSTWLKDYLYIPLGGNRNHCYRNILITMLLGGLWHGANWTFVVWGAYHGVCLVITHSVRKYFAGRFSAGHNAFVTAAKITFNFYIILIGWTIFRSSTVTQAWAIVKSMHSPLDPSVLTPKLCSEFWIVIILLAGGHLIDLSVRRFERRDEASLWGFGFVGILLALGLAMSGRNQPFIYFQF